MTIASKAKFEAFIAAIKHPVTEMEAPEFNQAAYETLTEPYKSGFYLGEDGKYRLKSVIFTLAAPITDQSALIVTKNGVPVTNFTLSGADFAYDNQGETLNKDDEVVFLVNKYLFAAFKGMQDAAASASGPPNADKTILDMAITYHSWLQEAVSKALLEVDTVVGNLEAELAATKAQVQALVAAYNSHGHTYEGASGPAATGGPSVTV